MKSISNRNSETLLKCIKDHVRPKTLIITDEWKGYKKLKENEFDHKTVNHSKHYVIQKMESIQIQLKGCDLR